ncbi:AfsR/SARP family transcriptional regulator [Actinokineospora globicatena]|uniref:AfsR/SARP family transcriptional regulator n=1 Tax=Actinokineospora globicatena TaxID=103729 RepID=UPI0020A58EB5|nr:AfsR/SARP family transcriptional regulator [Actinokineospora globicatena]MCP2303673.1 DNA-binding transcriptional activator of the SARP family [Actinokineospora globicatena]GLW79189.1 putative actinorhodin operon activatory protein [Actinokineospora globicatena]GLW86401.1 putative actinorhodin operon activatory protein [Actinokineospora globicatena]
MQVSVLGPLTAAGATASAAPSATKPKQVLALLALRANTVVSTARLIDELWGARPPQSAVVTVQTYVLRLRRLLTPLSDVPIRSVLTTATGGYSLCLDDSQLDYGRFRQRSALGVDALACGDFARAALLLHGALALWRGPALSDVRVGRLLEAHVTTMEQERLSVLEQRIDADLRLGRHLGVLGELAGLTRELPLHENLHAQYMVALYQAGRRYQALEVFRQLRQALADELGLSPTGWVERVHRAILTSDEVGLPILEVSRR